MTALRLILGWCLDYWYVLVIAAALAVLAGWGLKMRSERDAVRVEYSDYRREIAKAAQLAAEESLKRTIADEQRKEEADAENLRLHVALDATTRKLRDARARSSFVPAAASCPDRPQSAAFDRAELERALRTFDEGVQRLIDEGSNAVVDLDTAKRWVQSR